MSDITTTFDSEHARWFGPNIAHDHSGWWHTTEDDDIAGPWPTEEEAHKAFVDYVRYLETPPDFSFDEPLEGEVDFHHALKWGMFIFAAITLGFLLWGLPS